MNDSEEPEDIRQAPFLDLLQAQHALPKCKPISVGHPDAKRYMTPSPHPSNIVCTAISNSHWVPKHKPTRLHSDQVYRPCTNVTILFLTNLHIINLIPFKPQLNKGYVVARSGGSKMPYEGKDSQFVL